MKNSQQFYKILFLFFITLIYMPGCQKQNRSNTFEPWPRLLESSSLVGSWVHKQEDDPETYVYDIILLKEDGQWITAQGTGDENKVTSIQNIQKGDHWLVENIDPKRVVFGTSLVFNINESENNGASRRSKTIVYLDQKTLTFGSQLRTIVTSTVYERLDMSYQELLSLPINK